ncbi:MAG: tetratricopeptide repeat protein [Planctomycetes bacterium]|nr:tetratricopeptide repeat protein [Planctomycetota bacterium]
MRLSSVCVLLLPLWCSCVSPSAAKVTDSAVGVAEPEPVAAAPQGPVAMPASATDAPQLAIWRDPVFQQRFAESYLAETDIEPPPLTDDEREVMQEVVGLRADNQLDQAIALMRERAGPKANAVFDLTLAKLLLERERNEEAAAAYRVAVEKCPKFRRAWNDLGLIHYRQGDHKAAAQAFGRVVELGGASPMIYGLLGFAHANNDDALAAESAFRMASMLDPATVDWRMGLAHSLFKQRRFAEAASLFGALIAQQPDRGDLWLRQAQAYLGMNETGKAAENLELVDRLGQSTAETLDTLGNIYVNDELYDLAAGAYERAIHKDGKGGLAIALRAAKAFGARSATAETQRMLDSIAAMPADQIDAATRKDLLRLRARIALASGGGEEEAKVLEQIVAMDPLDGDALIKLGQYYQRKGQIEDAVFRFERAAGIAEFEADAKVRHAQLLVGQGKYGEALPLLRRAQALQPRDNIRQYLEQVERAAQGR